MLNTSASFLADGTIVGAPAIPIVGIVSAGEGWTSTEGVAFESVDFDLSGINPIAVEVRGDSMSPVYRSGDILVCSKHQGKHFDNLIGLDCVVLTTSGNGYVKILKRGSLSGLHTLKSYNPHIDDIEDVQLVWAAPVTWIKRSPR